jgi:ankyrin repeat protein
LWKHLKEKHQDYQYTSFDKTLRAYYEESTREALDFQGELDLELLEAASTGHAEKVSDLLSKKANISTMDYLHRTPLELAIAANHRAVVKLLCEHGTDTEINSGMRQAASSGNEAAIEILIEYGGNINYRDPSRGYVTALHYAAEDGNERMTRLLLEKGADTNIQSRRRGRTALHIAVVNGEGITRVLLRANADVDAKDLIGDTPLSYAIGISTYHGPKAFNDTTTKLLLEAGATVEQRHWDAMSLWFREQNAKYAPTPRPPPSARLGDDIAAPKTHAADEDTS